MKNSLIYRGFGRNRRMQWPIAINGRDHTPVDESTRLSSVCPILDGASRCAHVARVKRCIVSIGPLDLHRAVTINWMVHRSRLIMTVITPRMDRRD